MAKVTLGSIAADYASTSALNTNFDTIEDAFDNTLSLDGSTPNSMSANLDMNSNRIINLPDAPSSGGDAVNKNYVLSNSAAGNVATGLTSITSTGGTTQSLGDWMDDVSDNTTALAGFPDIPSDWGDISFTVTGGTNARDVGTRFTDTYTPFDFGCVGDGTTDDTTNFQAFITYICANKKRGYVPGGYTFKITTSLFYDSDFYFDMYGDILDAFGGGSSQGILCGRNYDTDGGDRQTNVHMHLVGKFVLDSRTITSPTRKVVIISFTDDFTITGLATSGTDDIGSYNVHFRDCTNGRISNMFVNTGDSVGEDGIHLNRNCENLLFNQCIIYSGDDAFSITQEGTASNAYTIKNITVNNCVFKTNNNSAFKILIDSDAAGASITDVLVENCHFGIHDGAGAGGSVTVSGPSSAVDNINRIRFVNCASDSTGGTYGGNSNLVQNVTGVVFEGFNIYNTNARGILFQNAYDCKLNGFIISDPQDPTELATGTVTDITFQSGSTVRATFASGSDLSGLADSSNRVIVITGAVNDSNNGSFFISDYDADNLTVDYSVDNNTRGSATDDETGLTATGTVNTTTLEAIGISGGDNIEICHGIIDNPGTSGIRTSQNSSTSGTHINIHDNVFKNVKVSYGIDAAGMKNSFFRNNIAIDCTCKRFINETDSTVCDNNTYEGNYEDGAATSHSRTSYIISRSTSVDRNNRGSNASKVSGTATVSSGNTTTTVTITILSYTKAYASSHLSTADMTIKPSSSLGSASFYWVTLSGRTYTIHLDADPGADVTFDYIIDAATTN